MGYFLTVPENGALVVIGVAGRGPNQTEERDAALDNAAHKVALYQGITGKEIREHRTDGSFSGFSITVETDIVYDTDYGKYREALRYDEAKDVLRTVEAVFVRCTYPVQVVNSIPYTPANGKPAWIHTPPQEIFGLLAGVGFAGRQRYLTQTITKSYENAISALLSLVSTTMAVHEIGDTRHGAVSEMVEVSEGVLNGFLVLETWIDPQTKSVWTLAVAKEANQ
jgi:hypothetical protein